MDNIESLLDIELFADKLSSANIELPKNVIIEIKCGNKLVKEIHERTFSAIVHPGFNGNIIYNSSIGIKFKLVRE